MPRSGQAKTRGSRAAGGGEAAAQGQRGQIGPSPTLMDWDKLRVFHAVAEAGSFTHAGDLLNLSQSAVSRQISGLEESLRVPLFHRHARGLILTEQGELLYRTAHDVFGKLAMTEAQIRESKDRPRGPLRITTTVAFGSTWLAGRMREFLDLYPDIETHLLLVDRELDLSMREADVAVRLSPPRQGDLIQRHLLTVHMQLYASPAYIQRNGMPRNAEDLDNHRIVVYGDELRPPVPDINWPLRAGRSDGNLRRPCMTVNNIYGIMQAIEDGVGIGSLPEYMVQGSSDFVQVLPELEGPQLDAYFVYPEEMRNSKRIQVFRDFLLRQVARSRF
ncbi:DNA-binding transcriptional regulator, LysR family [Limimonas halophila]|uniref:DNA-binding transcriptional regulator, LysR family n=2 Tax=Limimonas halophila TaxID=1082479 RepID=A0A1G7KYW4_9PROT|nr:DNA-binding transcriptional regulator, LysR family [Limimonas halophila]